MPNAALEVRTYGAEARPRVGFFTDTTLCIGCKACEVACKEWNGLPDCSKSCPTDSRAMIDRALNGEPPRRSG